MLYRLPECERVCSGICTQSPFLNFRIPEESNKRIIGYSSSNKIDVFLNIKYQSCNTLIQYYKQDSNKLIV